MTDSHGHSFNPATLVEILEHTLMVTFFVMVMMMLIEFVTLLWRGRHTGFSMERKAWQLPFAAVLGVIPGCLGAFTVVSLYLHRIFGFGPLLTTMISSTGDEAFVMLSMIPEQTLWLNLILVTLAIIAGAIVNLVVSPEKLRPAHEHDIPDHHKHDCVAFDRALVLPQLRNISFTRALLLGGGLLFLFYLFTGSEFHDPWGWEKVSYITVTFIMIGITMAVPEHFLTEHLWKHTIIKHLPRIFLWTLSAFLAIELLLHYMQLEEWIRDNTWIILLIALLVGIIPQSGPHLLFTTLFAAGTIPFSVLLANSIVQDGHGAIPLLAESGKSFILMKGIKLIIGFLAGILGIFLGF